MASSTRSVKRKKASPSGNMLYAKEGQKGEVIRFHSGTYAGKTGWLGSKQLTSSDRVGVVVDNRDGTTKNATVSIWSLSKPHPDKPKTYAQALMMQKPDVEKVMKMFAKMVIKSGGWKNDARVNSVLDMFYEEMEHAALMRSLMDGGNIEWND